MVCWMQPEQLALLLREQINSLFNVLEEYQVTQAVADPVGFDEVRSNPPFLVFKFDGVQSKSVDRYPLVSVDQVRVWGELPFFFFLPFFVFFVLFFHFYPAWEKMKK